MSKYNQGFFKPKNPQKYKGNPAEIVYRSSWELKLMCYLDSHDEIVEWQSEEFFVPYISPVDNRPHRYFPDFIVKKINSKGEKETLMIEIKPSKQTIQPKKKDKITKTYLAEVRNWGVNSAKWKAAEQYCKDRNWKFVIFTEKELGIK